ncbi:MAG: DegT/DnrJ/EryC1/StrS family aminotransferase, partial [Methanothrix sp.]|nr:DegT/DnrJ/EryC1/StrS family aminotransferase [Methanothrix sp.]
MIPLIDLTTQYQHIREEIDGALSHVLASGSYILGENVTYLEQEVADYIGVKYAVGVASGTDALIISLRALGIGKGHEVIVPTYTFSATA